MDHHNETPLSEKIRVCTEKFRPETREVWERYEPDEYWYGELLLHTHRSLTDKTDVPISAAAGVELFRAYGLTRERPPEVHPDNAAGCDSATLLAGDQFLSTSFAQISGEDGEAETPQQAIAVASRATRTLCAELALNGSLEAVGSEGSGDLPSAVTGSVTGQLAVDLARTLCGKENEADAGALTEAGSSVGTAVSQLGHDLPDGQVILDTDDSKHPIYKRFETPVREQAETARQEFGCAYGTVPPSLAAYFNELLKEADTRSD